MKSKKITILCFSFFLILVAAFGGIKEWEWDRQHSFSVEILSDGRTEEVKLWKSPSEEFFLFLPGYADLSQTQIRRHVSGPLYLDGKRLTGTVDCSGFPLNEDMELIHDPVLGYQWNKLTILQSGDVPTMFIDVKSGNMDYIHARKGNKESGTMRLYTADGKLDAMAVVDSLQGRGNSTWLWWDKKPYSLRLSEETDLLGMGRAGRWILLAEVFDKSFIKNKMTYDLAADAGMPYAPACQWVDLYLNGEYAGLYLLSERNEIHPNRVDLPEENTFLVSWESEHRMIDQGYPYVMTERGTALRIHHSAFAQEDLQKMWQSAENAIFAQDGIDPVSGKHWRELIDAESWARLFLLDEISADYDGGKISRFFYYKETDGVGKIYGGPVWDKDDTFFTGHWSVSSPNCVIASRSRILNGKEQRMFAGLYQKEEFAACVAELYQKEFLPLLQELYDTGIEAYARQVARSAQINECRWHMGYTPEQSLIIREFLGARMDFLEDRWIRKEEFLRVKVRDTHDGSDGEFAVRPGDTIPVLPEYAPEAGKWSWHYAESGEVFDVTQPVLEDVNLILKKVG